MSGFSKGDLRAQLNEVCSPPNSGHRKTAAARSKRSKRRHRTSYLKRQRPQTEAASGWSSWLLLDAIYSDDIVFGETFPNFSDGFIFR
jgi:hypothetical protein